MISAALDVFGERVPEGGGSDQYGPVVSGSGLEFCRQEAKESDFGTGP